MTAKRVRLHPGGPPVQVVGETPTSYLIETYTGCVVAYRKDMVEVVE